MRRGAELVRRASRRRHRVVSVCCHESVVLEMSLMVSQDMHTGSRDALKLV